MQCRRGQRREECGKHCFVVSDDDMMTMMKMMLIYTRKDTNNIIIHQIKWLRGQKPRQQKRPTKRERVTKNQRLNKKGSSFFSLSLSRAFVRVFSSVLSSLLSDIIRFRIGKNLLFIHNNQSIFILLYRCNKERVKERKTNANNKLLSNSMSRVLFERVKESV